MAGALMLAIGPVKSTDESTLLTAALPAIFERPYKADRIPDFRPPNPKTPASCAARQGYGNLNIQPAVGNRENRDRI